MNFMRWCKYILLTILIVGMCFPLFLGIIATTHDASYFMHPTLSLWPGNQLLTNIHTIFSDTFSAQMNTTVVAMLYRSFSMALLLASGKIVFALFAAFALVYFDFPYKQWIFGSVFLVMMLPIEVRIVPTFSIVASFGGLNHLSGLTLPLMVSAMATIIFRQFFKTIPQALVEAAVLDGAGPIRFFWDILIPLSKSHMAGLFVILFIYGWNQYLWPLILITEPSGATLMIGVRTLAQVADQIPEWHLIMLLTFIGLIPPCLLLLFCHSSLENGVAE